MSCRSSVFLSRSVERAIPTYNSDSIFTFNEIRRRALPEWDLVRGSHLPPAITRKVESVDKKEDENQDGGGVRILSRKGQAEIRMKK